MKKFIENVLIGAVAVIIATKITNPILNKIGI